MKQITIDKRPRRFVIHLFKQFTGHNIMDYNFFNFSTIRQLQVPAVQLQIRVRYDYYSMTQNWFTRPHNNMQY